MQSPERFYIAIDARPIRSALSFMVVAGLLTGLYLVSSMPLFPLAASVLVTGLAATALYFWWCRTGDTEWFVELDDGTLTAR
jgi:hypothetical protein